MIEVIWNSLLELKRLLSSCEKKNFSVQVNYTDNNFHIQVGVAETGQKPQIKFDFNNSNLPVSGLAYCWDESFTLIPQAEITPQEEYKFINTYLPYCFTTLKSHKLQRAYGISHYAQSLDAKIATLDGNSKWISHQEDLVHCHRMRALCDSILIGINTLRNDLPRLNVRHVKGNNPIRVVIGSSSASFSSLMQNNEKIIFFTSQHAKILQGVDQVTLPELPAVPVFVMKHLYKLGIHSVFIEGGSQTTSSFLESRMIDEVQLYIAPSIFGSGLSNFNLPLIRTVEEAITFTTHEFFPMGKGVFFKGDVSRSHKSETDHQ